MQLETKRLLLRPWLESDAADLYESAKDPDVGPAAGWPVHRSVENSREIIKSVLSAPGTFAIVLKSSGRAVGSIGLKTGENAGIELAENEAELGYWIGKVYWGMGLVPEAAEELLSFGFTVLGYDRIWCGYYDGNLKSRRVQEKCGFSYKYSRENVFCSLLNEHRTEHISCISKEEWEKR